VARAILHAGILVDEGVGQQGEYALDVLFILAEGLAAAGLLRGRFAEIEQLGAFDLLLLIVERLSVLEKEPADGAVNGLNLLIKMGAMLTLLLHPVTPICVAAVILQLVVYGLADKPVGIFDGCVLGATTSRCRGQNSCENPHCAHPGVLQVEGSGIGYSIGPAV
jgi:hypothetical protein